MLYYDMPKKTKSGQNQPQKGGPRKESSQETSPLQKSYTLTVDPSASQVTQTMLGWFRERNSIMRGAAKQFEVERTEHITNTKQNIILTSAEAIKRVPQDQPKTALFLGVGNCTDIPLLEVAQMFDSVTLVELDRQSVEQAVEQLPEELQKKIHVVIADITGVLGRFSSALHDATNNTNYADFVEQLKKLDEDIYNDDTLLPPDFGKNFSFVCSDLLLSQLNALPANYINQVAEKFYQQTIASQTDVSFHLLLPKLAGAHLWLIEKSVAGSGLVYFADTLSFIEKKEGGVEEEVPFIRKDEMEKGLAGYFEIIHTIPLHEDWDWHILPKNDASEAYSYFRVSAFALERKGTRRQEN
jgi:hypothetical protein